jgi:hypothetical protein
MRNSRKNLKKPPRKKRNDIIKFIKSNNVFENLIYGKSGPEHRADLTGRFVPEVLEGLAAGGGLEMI